MKPEETILKLKRKYAIQIRVAMRETAKELAMLIKELIIIRTRFEGKGTNGPLKELSDSYISQRRGELTFYTNEAGKKIPYTPSKKPKLHKDTSPEKSNLTATGQMLDALVAKSTANKAIVAVNDKKRKKELYGNKSTLTNNEVRRYVEDNGREFLKLSAQEKDQLIESATEIMKQHLRDLS